MADKIKLALDTEFQSTDCGIITARWFLKLLLMTLLEKGESFSGKHPFGNSGWEYELATPLIMAGVITGQIEDGYAKPDDEAAYQAALETLVEAL